MFCIEFTNFSKDGWETLFTERFFVFDPWLAASISLIQIECGGGNPTISPHPNQGMIKVRVLALIVTPI